MNKNEKFSFSTKAVNLRQLINKIRYGKICELFIISVDQWEKDKKKIFNEIKKRFNGEKIVIRSSGENEDSIENSQAGFFESVLNVSSENFIEVKSAMEKVIDSYKKDTRLFIGRTEILIQTMLRQVEVSGVIFTKELETYSPYYIINYDDVTAKTDTITGGCIENNKLIRINKNFKLSIAKVHLEPWMYQLIKLAKELEEITKNDSLDIEFAISDGKLFLLQVRPMVIKKLNDSNANFEIFKKIDLVKQNIRVRNGPKQNLYGNSTVYSDMTDWNPAEIIGTKPRKLAYSLYVHIVMKDIWRKARRKLGYYDPENHHLMVDFFGHPYVDVRNDFNSLIPNDLSDSLSNKLIDYYIKQLKNNPELHDKVEFSILDSCMTFHFDQKRKLLLNAGFTLGEVDELEVSLIKMTNSIIKKSVDINYELDKNIEKMADNRITLLKNKNEHTLKMVENLLADCINYGTLSFSVIVRQAFIAAALLKSLLAKQIISNDEYHDFLNSVETVSTEFKKDLNRCGINELSINEFLDKYGHLRPGTYDILIPKYNDAPELYLSFNNVPDEVDLNEKGFEFSSNSRKKIEREIRKSKLNFTVNEMFSFIKDTFAKRELYKFEFTKNLSAALDLICQFGSQNNLNKDELSFIDINSLLNYSHSILADDEINMLRTVSQINKKKYEAEANIVLPDVIVEELDLDFIRNQKRYPNFITSKSISGEIAYLDNVELIKNKTYLENKIVLIENADPGYEWIFTNKIQGLVTKYGGAASHMAIRCSENGIPAAIGCGQEIFEKLKKYKNIILDCDQKSFVLGNALN